MGTNEAGTAAASGIAGAGGGTDVGAKLIEEIRRVLSRIDAHAAGAGQAPDADATPATSPAPLAAPGTAPLDALLTCFGLTTFERDLILLAAADELDPTTAARCAAACGDPQRATRASPGARRR
ncbi:AAA family ATPase, partial [Streptomyces sp. NPDC058605]